VKKTQSDGPVQLELALAPRRPAEKTAIAPQATHLRVIQGGGQRKHEPLNSRNAVVRVLVEAGADLLLRRISPERAMEIEQQVNEILDLFDRVDKTPELMPMLRRRLDNLESLMGETRDTRRRPNSSR
jgi:hypothetical protein